MEISAKMKSYAFEGLKTFDEYFTKEVLNKGVLGEHEWREYIEYMERGVRGDNQEDKKMYEHMIDMCMKDQVCFKTAANYGLSKLAQGYFLPENLGRSIKSTPITQKEASNYLRKYIYKMKEGKNTKEEVIQIVNIFLDKGADWHCYLKEYSATPLMVLKELRRMDTSNIYLCHLDEWLKASNEFKQLSDVVNDCLSDNNINKRKAKVL